MTAEHDTRTAGAAANGQTDASALAARIAELEAQLAERNAEQPEEDALAILGELWSCELHAIERVGRNDDLKPDRYVTAKHRDRDEIVTFGPITSAELDNRRVRRRLFWEALGGDMGPLPTEAEHREALVHVARVEQIREHGHDDTEMWRARVASYAGAVGRAVDTSKRGSRSDALRKGHRVLIDQQCVLFTVEAFADHLRRVQRIPGIEDDAVARKLAHLGLTSEKLCFRPADSNGNLSKPMTLTFMRTPPGFFDAAEHALDDDEEET